jgi:hypothetical protein
MQNEERHLRRYEKANGENASTQAGADKKVATLFDDVPDREALTIGRRYDRSAYSRNEDLAAMGMTRNRECDT